MFFQSKKGRFTRQRSTSKIRGIHVCHGIDIEVINEQWSLLINLSQQVGEILSLTALARVLLLYVQQHSIL